jgi:hypothetical protein
MAQQQMAPQPQSFAAKGGGSSRKTIWITAGVLALAIACIAGWKLRPVRMPPLNSDPIVLARFVSSPDFERVSEQQKRPYRIALRAKTKELAAALQNGILTREQYDEAYLNGWLARQMDHMGDFSRLPIASRQQAWNEYYARKAKQPPPKEPQPAHEVEKAFIQRVVSTWPDEEQAKWEEFRSATKSAKKAASGN